MVARWIPVSALKPLAFVPPRRFVAVSRGEAMAHVELAADVRYADLPYLLMALLPPPLPDDEPEAMRPEDV